MKFMKRGKFENVPALKLLFRGVDAVGESFKGKLAESIGHVGLLR